jgi:glycosyltransferase involved in cell wall biosynthesis
MSVTDPSRVSLVRAPLLSILIATVGDRDRLFAALLEHVKAQCRPHAWLGGGVEPGTIEILWERDHRELSIGAKRQKLLERARGDFVVFIDDDDWVADSYVARILDAIAAHPGIDCVGLVGEHTTDGRHAQRVAWSLRYRAWGQDRDGYRYVRPPCHITPVLRTAALRAGFLDERYAEDRGYSARLVGLLHHEHFIVDEVLYRHRYRTDAALEVKFGIPPPAPLTVPAARTITASAPRFSTVVIARNEARTLPRLVRSLAPFVDRGGEVLVVDTGSTDGTVEVARRHGCRVHEAGPRFESRLTDSQAEEIERRFARADEGPLVLPGERLFHFADARQYAGMLAANDHVLQLDASDEVCALDVLALDACLAAAGPVGLIEYGLRLGGATLRVTRFYDRRLYRWRGRVHEGLYGIGDGSGPAPSRVCCAETDLAVRHHRQAKSRTYLAGLALDALAHPAEARWKHYLGRELFYGQKYRSALPVLADHAASADTWAAERSQSLCFMGECLEALAAPDAAATQYRRAARVDPTRREPLLRLAALHCRRGEFDAAVAATRDALTVPRTSGFAELDANYTWLPHSILYWCLFWLGRHAEARHHWDTCRRLAPDLATVAGHARLFPPAAARNEDVLAG